MHNKNDIIPYFNRMCMEAAKTIDFILKSTLYSFLMFYIYTLIIGKLSIKNFILMSAMLALMILYLRANQMLAPNPNYHKEKLFPNNVRYFTIILVLNFIGCQILLIMTTTINSHSEAYRGFMIALYLVISIFGTTSLFKSLRLSAFNGVISIISFLLASLKIHVIDLLPLCIIIVAFLLSMMRSLDKTSIACFEKDKQIVAEHRNFLLCLDNSNNHIAVLSSESSTLKVDYYNSLWSSSPFKINKDTEIPIILSEHEIQKGITVMSEIKKEIENKTANTSFKKSYDIALNTDKKHICFKVDISVIKIENSHLIFVQYIDNTSSIEIENHKLSNKIICSISHELLTPMNSVISVSDSLRERSLDNHLVSTLNINVTLLHLKIRDFISYSEFVTKTFFIKTGFHNLKALIENVCTRYLSLIHI